MSASRSERARRQVLATTADLVTEVGVERLTIDEVAASTWRRARSLREALIATGA